MVLVEAKSIHTAIAKITNQEMIAELAEIVSRRQCQTPRRIQIASNRNALE